MNLTYEAHGATDIGKKRKENQDNFIMDKDIGLFIVADGLGGLDYGAEASEYATRRLLRTIRAGLEALAAHGQKDEAHIRTLLINEIYNTDEGMREHFGLNTATTVVIALIQNDEIYITHVGDSRAYMFKRNVLHQITEDHNLAAQLVADGQLSKIEAMSHWSSCQLLTSIGMMNESEIEPVINKVITSTDLRLLLCSDGVTGMIIDSRIEAILRKAESPKLAVMTLINRSNDAGGHDNITALVVDVKVTE